MRGLNGNKDGVVLMEVLTAVAILGTACLVLARGFSESSRRLDRSERSFRAALALERAAWQADRTAPDADPVFERADEFTLSLNRAAALEDPAAGYLTARTLELTWANERGTESLSTYAAFYERK